MSNITAFPTHDSDEVTVDDAHTAYNLLYELRIVGKLLKQAGENRDELECADLPDLGRLILRLSDQPLGVVDTVLHEKNDTAEGSTS